MPPRSYRQHCLVLKKTKLAETDAIITMLSEEGLQVRAVAKGVRKPGNRIGARLEPFSEVDVLLHRGRSLDVVTEVRSVQTNADCRTDIEKSSAALVVAEFLDKSTRDGAAVGLRVFALSSKTFGCMSQADSSHCGLLTCSHILKTMAMQGFKPALYECALCGEPVKSPEHFDIAAGGTLCVECAGDMEKFHPNQSIAALVSWMNALIGTTLDEQLTFENVPIRELLDLTESWLREHLSMNLRSMGFLKSLY